MIKRLSAFCSLYQRRFVEWYGQLEPKRQGLLIMVATFTAGLFIIFQVWRPLQATQLSAERYYQDQQELYGWITDNSALIKANPAPTAASGQGSSSEVYKSAEKFGLKIDQLTMGKQNIMQVQLREVSFSSLVRWLDNIEQKYNLHVRHATLSSASTESVLDVSLDLSN